MKIAHFHTGTILSSWSNLAVPETLRSLDHEVLEGTIPTDASGRVLTGVTQRQFNQIRDSLPTFDQLKQCDVVWILGPEFIGIWLDTIYGAEWWKKLDFKIAEFLESSQRDDVRLPLQEISLRYDACFFPDKADAERFGGFHATPAVDTDMFCPEFNHPYWGSGNVKDVDAGFAGTVYRKRADFLNKLLPLIPEIDFKCGPIAVRGICGEYQREWAELLVRDIRRMKIHVNLPSNNGTMMVSRPLETLACGTFALVPKTPDNPLKDGEHCIFYDPESPSQLAELIRYYLSHEDERERIAAQGTKEVREKYSLRSRLAKVIATISEVRGAVSKA